MGIFDGSAVGGKRKFKLSQRKKSIFPLKRKPCIIYPGKSPRHKKLKFASPYRLRMTPSPFQSKRMNSTPLKPSTKKTLFSPDKKNAQQELSYFKMPDELLFDLKASEINDSEIRVNESICDKSIAADSSMSFSSEFEDCELDNEQQFEYSENDTSKNEELIHALLPDVIRQFESNGKLDVLSNFFRLVKDESFPMKNIAFLLWCDIVTWFESSDTRQMRYSPECLQFFWVGKKLFGGRFIRFMSGMKSETDMLKGKHVYDPRSSKVNFACPSMSVLNAVNPLGDELPLTHNPGILEAMIRFKAQREDKNNSYVLMVDGKKIKRGTDVDLLGFETDNNLQQRLDEKQNGLTVVNNAIRVVTKSQETTNDIRHMDQVDKNIIITMLLGLVLLFSTVLQGLRRLKMKKNFAVTKLKNQAGIDWKKSKYAYSIDMCLTTLWKINNIIDKTLKVLTCLCKAGAHVNGVGHLFADKKYVNLNKQENLRMLKPPDCLPVETDLTNTTIIKQRSDVWFNERKKMKVTGSTIYKALGCDGLKRQKEHYDKVINNIQPPEPSETQKSAMQHGTDSECHQIATMTGIIMPFLYPDLIFQEEGFYLYNHTMVSPDGSLRSKDNTVKYAFEGKAPVEKSFAPTLHEQVPGRYITQTLYEQRALNADGTLYMSWTDESCTLFKVIPDEDVCEHIDRDITELYLTDNPKRPSRLTTTSKKLKEELSEVGKKCVFLGEFPSAMGIINDNITECDTDSPYIIPKPENAIGSNYTLDELQRHLLLGEEILNESYEVQRVMASQVVFYLLADLDRFWKNEQPHAIPVLYFYRGYSLSMDIARSITESCKAACISNGLDVIASASDGEFTPLIVRGRAGNPLTQHQLSKDVWKEVGKMTKADIIKTFLSDTKAHELHMDTGKAGNCIRILLSETGSLCRIATPKSGWLAAKVNTTEDLNSNKHDKVDSAEVVSSVDNLSNVIELSESNELDASEVSSDTHDTNIDNEHIETEEMNDTEQRQEPIVNVGEISFALTTLNKDKWSKKSESDIMHYFETAETLKKLNVKELNEITKCINNKMEEKDRLKMSGLKKHQLVNHMSVILGDGSKMEERVLHRKRHVESLKTMAQRSIMKKSYPKKVLNVAYSNYIWPNKLCQWKRDARIHDTINICGVSETFEPYYVPDESVHGDFEVFIYDKTHLGSNLRKCICLNRVTGISKKAWYMVSEKNPIILNPMLLEVTEEGKIIDQMKERLARNMVSEDVEHQMRVNGDTNEADFCEIIREGLYSADDTPGIPAAVRCQKRLRLIQWLDEGVDFGCFPPFGGSIKGLSTILYEGMRSSNEAKLYLYALSKKGTYNVRSPNTLCSESFFSTMQEMEPWGQGVLTSDGVQKHISDFTTITALKMKEDRSFCMRTKRDTAYPTQTMTTAPTDGERTVPVVDVPLCECRANRYITCIVPR